MSPLFVRVGNRGFSVTVSREAHFKATPAQVLLIEEGLAHKVLPRF